METTQNLPSTSRETEVVCECGKVCKNLKGLRVHKSKIACVRVTSRNQRLGTPPSESQENTSQEEHHSTRNLQEDELLHDDEQALEYVFTNQSDSSLNDSVEEAQESGRERVARGKSEVKDELKPKVK